MPHAEQLLRPLPGRGLADGLAVVWYSSNLNSAQAPPTEQHPLALQPQDAFRNRLDQGPPLQQSPVFTLSLEAVDRLLDQGSRSLQSASS